MPLNCNPLCAQKKFIPRYPLAVLQKQQLDIPAHPPAGLALADRMLVMERGRLTFSNNTADSLSE